MARLETLSVGISPRHKKQIAAAAQRLEVSDAAVVRALLDHLDTGSWATEDGEPWPDLEAALIGVWGELQGEEP